MSFELSSMANSAARMSAGAGLKSTISKGGVRFPRRIKGETQAKLSREAQVGTFNPRVSRGGTGASESEDRDRVLPRRVVRDRARRNTPKTRDLRLAGKGMETQSLKQVLIRRSPI